MASILAGAMMLRHIGENEASEAIESAVRRAIADGKHLTRDLGGGFHSGVRRRCGEPGEHPPLGQDVSPLIRRS
jgi:isocitrate/isopropylmalate dehydrogenase